MHFQFPGCIFFIYMIGEEVINFIENWAPPGASWDKDNVGLQVGSPKQTIINIFLCLELTEKSLNEAIKKKSNFIFTHHPFIFKPIKQVNTDKDPKAKIIQKLLKNDISLYSAHTNLDFTKGGVSFVLAEKLGLTSLSFLEYQNSNQFKIIVFVPFANVTKVSEAMFNAGAGRIGEYDNCSFQASGIGTFKGSESTKPFIGEKNKFESVEEVRLEVLADSWNLNSVLGSIYANHPYEEPAIDVYPLKNYNPNYGYGVIGELEDFMDENVFMSHVCSSLGTQNLRYTKGLKRKIKKVAVCGGSGSDLINSAINRKADAFITADIKYHAFQDAENKIMLIDAGHYETEVHVLNEVKNKLEEFIKLKGESVKIIKYSGSTNPIKFFNNKGVK